MKRKIIRILVLEMMLFLIIALKSTVEANSIDSINMDIYIDSSGNANVTETWKCNTNSGTECYHPYYNLGNSKITNLTVSSDEREYSTINSWRTSDSFERKSYKCGINNISKGTEICWGISKYGQNTYKVKYRITNFVSNLTDSQMVYWTLIPYEFSNTIKEAKVKIYSDNSFEDTIPVWGYGNYGGLCYVNYGAIYMQSNGSLTSDEYMTILAKFPKGMFNSNNNLNESFEYYYQKAQDGAEVYNKNGNKENNLKVLIFPFIFSFIMNIIPVVLIFIVIFKGLGKSNYYGFDYGKEGKKIGKNVPYFRDIPCEGNLFKSYYIAYQYNLIKNKSDLLGAILLKWIKDGLIRTENKQGRFFTKKEDTIIVLGDRENKKFDNSLESDLFEMMYIASEDGILENKEFERWCKKSFSKILGWFDDILSKQRSALVEEGYIEKQNRKFWGIKYIATKRIKDEAEKIEGLKRYLLEYTLIKDRQAIEVEVFENYLIFAQMLGIAKKVSKEFKTLYPELIEKTNFANYEVIEYINYSSLRGIQKADNAKAAHKAASSYSSGGGGFSSGGGGSGSFGGGGGGGRIPLILRCFN